MFCVSHGVLNVSQFAHGREELRPVPRHPKYKTEVRGPCMHAMRTQLQQCMLRNSDS